MLESLDDVLFSDLASPDEFGLRPKKEAGKPRKKIRFRIVSGCLVFFVFFFKGPPPGGVAFFFFFILTKRRNSGKIPTAPAPTYMRPLLFHNPEDYVCIFFREFLIAVLSFYSHPPPTTHPPTTHPPPTHPAAHHTAAYMPVHRTRPADDPKIPA